MIFVYSVSVYAVLSLSHQYANLKFNMPETFFIFFVESRAPPQSIDNPVQVLL